MRTQVHEDPIYGGQWFRAALKRGYLRRMIRKPGLWAVAILKSHTTKLRPGARLLHPHCCSGFIGASVTAKIEERTSCDPL